MFRAEIEHCPQLPFFERIEAKSLGVPPSTRYQGSKFKLLKWIDYHSRDLKFDSILDAFGGTGSVAYMFKKNGKRVFYNDYLKFNHHIGTALIENKNTILNKNDLDFILTKHHGNPYPTFIHDTFQDIYFTREENEWLDFVVANIGQIQNRQKQALAYYALFQSCIIKRPYNLFHRKNLYIRTAKVSRSFGNKKTWDTPFADHFRNFAGEISRAVFDNGQGNLAFCSDIFNLDDLAPDLVYIDSPYISAKGIGVNYFDFYHFLEGLADYDQWQSAIDQKSKHKKLKNKKNEWCDKALIHLAFERLFHKFQNSILVISYREDGIPKISELVAMLKIHKKSVAVKELDYQYALSCRGSKEVLIIAK